MLIKGFTPLKVPRGILLAAALAALLLAVAAIALSQPASAQVDEDDRFAVLIPYQVTDTTAKVKIAECVSVYNADLERDECSLPVEAEGEEGSNLADYLDTWHSPHLSDWYGEFSIYVIDDSDPDNYPFPVHCNDDRGRNRFERSAEFEGLQPNTTYQMNMLPGSCEDNAIANSEELQDAVVGRLLSVTDMGLGEPTLTTLAADPSRPAPQPDPEPSLRFFRQQGSSFRLEIENWTGPWHAEIWSPDDELHSSAANAICVEGSGERRIRRIVDIDNLKPHTEYRVTAYSGFCNDVITNPIAPQLADPAQYDAVTTLDVPRLLTSQIGRRSAMIRMAHANGSVYVDDQGAPVIKDTSWIRGYVAAPVSADTPLGITPATPCTPMYGHYLRVRGLPPGSAIQFKLFAEPGCETADAPADTDATRAYGRYEYTANHDVVNTKSLVGFQLVDNKVNQVRVDLINLPSGNHYWSSSATGCQPVPNNDRLNVPRSAPDDQPLVGIYLTPQCGWDGSDGINSNNPDRFGAQAVWRAPKHPTAVQITEILTFATAIDFRLANHVGLYSYRLWRDNGDQTLSPVPGHHCHNRDQDDQLDPKGNTLFMLEPETRYRIVAWDQHDCAGWHVDVDHARTRQLPAPVFGSPVPGQNQLAFQFYNRPEPYWFRAEFQDDVNDIGYALPGYSCVRQEQTLADLQNGFYTTHRFDIEEGDDFHGGRLVTVSGLDPDTDYKVSVYASSDCTDAIDSFELKTLSPTN